jgi:glycosyl transferase family 25
MSKFSKDQMREDLTAVDTVRDCQERKLEFDRCGIYLINLDRSADRLKAVTQAFSEINLQLQRVVAIDASHEDLSSYLIDHSRFRRRHGRTGIRGGEIGCYFSHLKAMTAFIQSDYEFGLILEDDAMPEPHLLKALDTLGSWADDWDVVPLFHVHRGAPVTIRHGQEISLNVHLANISSAAAYLVNRYAAVKLLQHLAVMQACIDHSLYETWQHGLKLRGVLPMPIKLMHHASQSTINAEAVDKPMWIFRFPTFILRSYIAIRFSLFGLWQLSLYLLRR